MNAPLISIVLPVYNEGERVALIVESYLEALKDFPAQHEIILVTNGCKDNSQEVCAALARTHDTVRVHDTKEAGWGRAVKLGLQHARGDFLCYTNLSRTTAEGLTSMLTYALAHPGAVIKSNRKIRESWRRRLGSLLYNLECRSLFDLSAWDINGTPKIFPRSFSRLLALTRDDDLIDAEFNIICRREDYPLIEVPTFSNKRHGGSSTTNYRSAWKMYWGAFQMWRSLRKDRA
ncbi:MAG TPA: glycosyltransferase family 2 protein [Pyrinomonadaceae bacterium]|nr:glycosyltransferase family 2 protein [Pyrinomonadaceae bacterium]